MSRNKKPAIPISGIVYGEIIYWGTCFSALLVLFGTLRSFLESEPVVSVNYLLDAVLSGKNVEDIWISSALQKVPDASVYISMLDTGEGMTVMGIAFGVLTVVPAIFFSSIYLWKSNNHVFAIVAIVSGLFTLVAPSGLLSP